MELIPVIDPVFKWIILLAFTALFAASALHKLRDFDRFAMVVGAYGILPERFVHPVATALIALEVLIALLLPLQIAPVFAPALAMFLLASYGWVILLNVRRRNIISDCGCGIGSNSNAVSMPLVWRNLLLIALAASLLMPAAPRPLLLSDYLAIAFMTVFIALIYLTTERLIGNWATQKEVLGS